MSRRADARADAALGAYAYVDLAGATQGPFAARALARWHEDGFLERALALRRDGDGREKKRWTHDLVVQGRVPDVAQLRRVEGVAIHARIDRCGAFEDVARAMVGTTRLTARERRR